MARKRAGRFALPRSGRARFEKNCQSSNARATDSRHRAPGNGCGRGPKAMGKAETASRNKNVSGAADSGESRDGGTRAVSFSDPSHNESRSAMGCADVSLARRPHGQGSPEGRRAARNTEGFDETRDSTQRRRREGEPKIAKCEVAVRGK